MNKWIIIVIAVWLVVAVATLVFSVRACGWQTTLIAGKNIATAYALGYCDDN